MQTFAHGWYSGKLVFSLAAADSGFSPPLSFVEKPLTALLVADIGRRLRQVTTAGKKTEARPC
jgi:hypothetical protein